jgi:hypothetical protein
MLNSFLKNKVGTQYAEDVKNCILSGKDTNEIYIEQTSDDSVFVSCTINGTGLVDVDAAFYKHLLEENSNNNRDTSPLYWSVNTDQNIVSCSGFVVFNDLLTCEEELYTLVSTLIGYKFNAEGNIPVQDSPPANLSAIINKV